MGPKEKTANPTASTLPRVFASERHRLHHEPAKEKT